MLLSGLSLWRKLVRNRVYGASIPKSRRRAGRHSRQRDWSAAVERLEDRTLLSPTVGIGNGESQTDFGSIVPIVNETGHISLSVDALGTSASSGTIQVDKPTRATVRRAFLAAASTGGSNYNIPSGGAGVGGITLNGSAVNWSITTPSSIFSWNHWADVTSLVKPTIDAASAGVSSLTVVEGNSSRIDGSILAVVFDDPNQPTNNTVALLFGAQNINGDTFNVGFGDPINKSDPNLSLEMSLGISFGFQGSSQFSIVNVNGTRLSTSAGGQDDGAPANGALVTVGGIGDSPVNPANPFATPSNTRTDDELYDLLPFVPNGATSLSVFTQNPSRDDNIFFAAFNLKAATAVVGEGVVLGPAEATHEVGETHTATATLQNSLGQPITNRAVTFEILSGPHAGTTATGVTNASGQATFTYTGVAAGNDQVRTRFLNNQNQTVLSNNVVVHWIQTNRPPSVTAGGPYDVNEGASVTLTAQAQDLDGDTVTFAWDLDNDATFETSGQSVTFSAAALDGPTSHTVRVRGDDGHGHTVVSEGTVNVANVAPTANAGADQTVNEGALVSLDGSFSDPGAADTHTFLWTVSATNGQVIANGTSEDFSFTPNDNGTYTLTYTVTDDDGGANSDTVIVTVNNVAPTANAGADQTVNEGALVSLDGSFSDPGTADTHTFLWTVSATNGQVIANGTSEDFSFTPNDNGTYTLTYTVTDDDGGANSDTVIVTVNNVAPTANAGADQTVNEGAVVSLDGSFSDPGTADTHTFLWTVSASNAQVIANGTSEDFSFTPNDNGTYTLTYTVTDDDGGADSDTVVITVNNVAPTANAGADQKGNEGTLFSLDGSFSDPGTTDAHTFMWTVSASNGQTVANGTGEDFSFTPNDNGTYTLTYTVTDDDGGANSDTVTVLVGNVAPTANAGSIQKGNEGALVSLDGSFSDPGTADTHTFLWTVSATNGQTVANGTGEDFSFTPNDNGTYTLTYTVTDDDGGADSDTVVITVNNVAPTANAGADQTVNEGSLVSLDGSFSDPGSADTHTFLWTVSASNTQVIANGTGEDFSFTPNDNGTYTIDYTVTDDDGGAHTDQVIVTVNNVAPQNVNAGADQTVEEGDMVNLSGSFTDPGSADTHGVLWVVASSNGQVVANANSPTNSFVPNDNGTYTVTFTATDDDGGVTSDTMIVTVTNVAPHDVAIGAAVSELVFAVGNPQAFGGSFGDVGTADTHTAEWTFTHVVGTDTVTETRTGAVNQTADTVDNAFSFAEAGVYTVTLTVTDDDSGVTSSESRTFVVYDPSEGFVTGGGWINSPAGAYVADATLTGKATFGFVSKYQRGQTTPTGNTTFQFKVADLEFKSTSYEWLVVAGARAQYKGVGTVNGAGNYGFLLTVIDGQVTGGGGTDKFRMKIWDKNNADAIVYDNALGASDDAAPPTALGGGSVIIHTNGNAETAAPGAAGNGEFRVLSYDILQPVVEQAIAYWAAAGADAQQIDLLHQVDVQIADLDGPLLGMASVVNMVWIDVDAAGIGWSVTDAGAFAGFDLVSVVSHELGHMLGLDDISDLSDVMGEYLSPGVRRLPDGQFAEGPSGHGDEIAATVDFPLFELQSAPEFEGIDGAENDGRWGTVQSEPGPWIADHFGMTDEDDLPAFSFDESPYGDALLLTGDEQDGMDAVFADVNAAWDELLLV